ncbi:hypothetical protein DASB73_001460 [Starmerella bacillaris]|uniref:GH16 domain-containing protein n=1 Tax=Starmerella bacillaris TaxID=1247836 RepID=A0AAV5RCJ7_STABA|nr:hypothetical protein DASB73_001460 [Starmerella bacillaris]
MQFLTISALLASKFVFASDSIPSCGDGLSLCPEEYPCCSTDGTCGNGYVCLGGCDPRYSYEPGACVPMPKFSNNYNYTFSSNDDGVVKYADYLGDAEKSPWSYYGNITYVDNKLRTQMYSDSVSTTVSSSYYLWYGKVTIRMKTAGTTGIVSDFILLSGVKDEIDYEFVGYNLTSAQTNYYWQGILDYENMIGATVSSDTNVDYHDYTIDWQEDKINWIIDGTTVRTLNKADTKNSTTGEYMFPQTPSRIQFGLWPAGDSSAEGTAEWAGGKINWDDMGDTGYFYVEVESVSVETYDPPSSANVTGSKSYVYTGKDGLADSVALTDDDYVLGSTDGTGLKLDGSLTNTTSSASNISSSAAPSTVFSSSVYNSSVASSTVFSSKGFNSSAVPSSAFSSRAASSSAYNSISLNISSAAPSRPINSSSIARSSSAIIRTSSSANRSSIVSPSSYFSSPIRTSSVQVPSASRNESTTGGTTVAPTVTSSVHSSSVSSHNTSTSTTISPHNAAAVLAVPAFAFILPLLI